MKLLQQPLAFLAAFLLMLGFTFSAQAQQLPQPGQQPQEVREDFSNDELEKFVSAATKVQEVQQTHQQDMISAIEGEDMDVNRFNEIMAVQQGQNEGEEVSEEEMESFNAAAQKVMEHQRVMQSEIAETIEGEGISTDTYNQILMAYQQSPTIQEKITKLLENDEQN